MPATVSRRRMNDAIRGIQSADQDVVLHSTKEICAVMKSNPNSIKRLPKLGVLPRLAELLQMRDRPDIQLRSAAVLVHVEARTDDLSDQRTLVEDACSVLIQAFQSPNGDVEDRCFAMFTLVRALLAASHLRDILVGCDIVGALAHVIQELRHRFENDMIVPTGRMAALLCNHPQPLPLNAEKLCQLIIKVLLSFATTDTVLHICNWITDKYKIDDPVSIRRIDEFTVLDCLVHIVAHCTDETYVGLAFASLEVVSRHWPLRLVGKGLLVALNRMLINLENADRMNFLYSGVLIMLLDVVSPAGTDHNIVQAIVDAGLMPHIGKYFHLNNDSILYNTAKFVHTVGRICTREQLMEIFQAGILPRLVDMSTFSWNPRLMQMAIMAIRVLMVTSQSVNLDHMLHEALLQLDLNKRLAPMTDFGEVKELTNWMVRYDSRRLVD